MLWNFLDLVEKVTMAGLLNWNEIGSEEVDGHVYKSYRAEMESHRIDLWACPWMRRTLVRRREVVGGVAYAVIIRGSGGSRWWSNRPNEFRNVAPPVFSEEIMRDDTIKLSFFFMTMRHLIEDRDVLASLRTLLAHKLYSPQAV